MKKQSVRGKNQFALRVSSGFNQGALITLSKKKSVLGRSFKVSIPLEDERASREHTEIVNENGKYFVQDLGSTNGTYLNDELLEQAMELRAGDIIRIGNSVFRFEALNIRGLNSSERWKNETSVIPRANFSFAELSQIQPDKNRFLKKQIKNIRIAGLYVMSYTLREMEFFFVKTEQVVTRLFLRFHQALQNTRFLK